MAICEVCSQEMNTARSCEVTTINIDDVEYDLTPYGQETRFGWQATGSNVPSDTRCHDCGVLVGSFHHPGCDVAECPRCHGQLITCDCLGDFDEDEEDDEGQADREETIIEDLFLESPDPGRVTYKDQELIRSDRFPIKSSSKLKVVFESVGSDFPQGIMLDSDLLMEIEGQTGRHFVLWFESAPPEVIVTCDPREESIWVNNAWDPNGAGQPHTGMGASAMIVEELPEGRRYRCNDVYPDDDFDDLVFRIERHVQTPK